MATKKNPELTKETEIQEEKAIVKEPAAESEELKAKDAEIAKLKQMLEAAKKPFTGSKESDFDRVHRIEKETDEAGIDPWTVEVEVLAPHREKSEDPWYWINVNSRSVQIPANDRYQKMWLPFACVLVDTLAYEKKSLDYQDSLEVLDPETNPHR